MEICQIKYLTSIIENDFNITRAAEKLHISQPALSKSITILENEINTQLFARSRGRLTSLTPSGQIFYEKSKAVLTRYDELNEIIKFRSVSSSGTLLIGIPPLVITALFPNFFNQLQIDSPNIQTSIIEYGAVKLTEMMKDLQLDISVLLSPTGLSPDEYEEIFIHEGEIAVYTSDTHPLAKKDKITWNDLNHQDIAICDETYRTYHLFLSKLKEENIEIASLHTVNSWDYLFASIRNSYLITLFPYVSKYLFNMQGIKEIHIENPIQWKIVLTYRKKKSYPPIEKYIIDYFVNYFRTNKVTLS